MYLKYLEIQGFKSFPDKTLVSFGHDITAIVGPNGSGKSNISDAIRWVMGEQNSRSLRGQKMEDVIFGGTEKRSQVGFAEATLVLDNCDRALPFDSDEMMITRRYYRSGESEYYINKQSVRLKDIHELFMDTGLGREGYSNISQGRIDEILSVKSTDRREIFEEAAGISKYRHRKEETERRLANTEGNLLRIEDKISELELQVEPLREQSEKAKKYLAYRDELKGIEVALWLHSLERLSETARKAEEDYLSAAFILQQEHAALESLYADGDSLTEQLRNRDQKIEQMREDIAREDTRVQEIQGQLAVLHTNLENCQSNIERIRGELAEQDERNSGVEEQISSLNDRVEEIRKNMEGVKEKIAAAEAEGQKLALSAEGMTRQYLTLRNEQEHLRTELSACEADLFASQEAVARNRERKEQVLSDCQTAIGRQEDARRQHEQASRLLNSAKEEVVAAKNTIEGYLLRSKTRIQKRDALLEQVRTETVALDTLRSKRKLFEEMEREFEGYSKAVRDVMQQSRKGGLKGIHGPVSKLIRTDDAYTIAIEIALGSAMQQIVVEDEQAAKAAIGYLKRNDAGRATFLPMSVIEGRELNEKGLESCRGFVGLGSKLVRCEREYARIISNLLGKTVIAENMDAAIQIADRYAHRFRIVTLDGQIIHAGGSMTGGSVSRNTGILSRANEIERLKKDCHSAELALSELKTQLSEAERLVQQVSFELSAEEGKLRSAEDEVLRLSGEERQFSLLVEAIGEAISVSERELDNMNRRDGENKAHQAELQEQIKHLNRQITEKEQELAAISDGQSVAAERSNAIGAQLTELRMELAAQEAERITALDSIGRLRGLEAAMQGDRSQKLTLLENYCADGEALHTQILAVQDHHEREKQLVQEKRDALQRELSQRMEIEARKTATEKSAQNKNRDILSMERESARLEAKKNSAEMEEKQIIDRLWDSYELTPSTASDVAAAIESIGTAQKQAADLKRKIGAIGTPNLGAIDEFARVNERYTYLTEQRNDVLTSKRELEGIIHDITVQMTEIFTGEFARINTYFGQTFTEMFGGGKASLELEDGENPLSCGIDIRVQPPGKQLKTITLLSGGEKAFVAIALYFAILKVRPTPFCMLDEIDAALDDRNVERFASYLRGLSRKTQFIVITHRRGTMEASDVLYGVTMQEQGISKILHLDLNQMEKQLHIISEK
ncbi:MAG: chromosome segregation protein SMC [Oscillospiraceae bacterium]|nr:chromosome segregation protein SMC [Oscillospiraceae bacterium]